MKKILYLFVFVSGLLAGCVRLVASTVIPIPPAIPTPTAVVIPDAQITIGSVEVIAACAGSGCGKTCSEPTMVTDWVGRMFTNPVIVDQTWDGDFAWVFMVDSTTHTLAFATGLDQKSMVSSAATSTVVWEFKADEMVSCPALWISEQMSNAPANYTTMVWENLVETITGFSGPAIVLSTP